MDNTYTGKIKVTFVYYLSITTLVLLLAAIFFTINNAMDKQKINTRAQVIPPTVTITPSPSRGIPRTTSIDNAQKNSND